MKCNPDAPDLSPANFEWCNGAWEDRTTLGDCQCSH